MELKNKPREYVNTIFINGVFKGIFISNTHWIDIGSKRSLVELVLKEYHAEIDIEIYSHNIETLLFVGTEI
jgi:hypothetical protein